jgi:hypothetical protein
MYLTIYTYSLATREQVHHHNFEYMDRVLTMEDCGDCPLHPWDIETGYMRWYFQISHPYMFLWKYHLIWPVSISQGCRGQSPQSSIVKTRSMYSKLWWAMVPDAWRRFARSTLGGRQCSWHSPYMQLDLTHFNWLLTSGELQEDTNAELDHLQSALSSFLSCADMNRSSIILKCWLL